LDSSAKISEISGKFFLPQMAQMNADKIGFLCENQRNQREIFLPQMAQISADEFRLIC
jgi:hypothetical protein